MGTKPRTKTTKPRRVPSRSDGKVTVEILVEAAARILEKHGADKLNTNEIARVAGTSVGTVYRYFPNKHAITAALVEHTQRELLDAFSHALAAPATDLYGTVHNVCLALVGVYQQKRLVHRYLFDSIGALGLSEVYAQRMVRYAEHLAPFFAAHPDFRIDDAQRAAELIVFTAEGFAYNIAHRAAAISDAFADDLARMYAGYLTGAYRRSSSLDGN